MLGQRRRRWARIGPALGQRLVFVGGGGGSTTLKYIVSTVHRSHLLTLITKAIDTTSISYQPLWLCCWRGDISSFLQTTRLF